MSSTEYKARGAHKFIAPTGKEALRMARETLGQSAMVLGSQVLPEGGVELVAIAEEENCALVQSAKVMGQTPSDSMGVQEGATDAAPELARPAGDAGIQPVLSEISSIRSMIEERLDSVVWNDRQRRDPVRGRLLQTMLAAGFSARLSKAMLERLPPGQSYADGLAFVRSELVRTVPVQEDETPLLAAGGVYALVGPTGVGKTTTTAKLAARCVMSFGAEKLALVTTDGYRIGAYEQLRIYGQILGVPVYAVDHQSKLEAVLHDLRDKHMVLIDTVGMSQRDRAVTDQIAMLCGGGREVKRILLLNAAAHGDTLNEVVYAYQAAGLGNQLTGCIFTKLDEAPSHGALLDTVIRHRLPVYYLSNGQKVPENLETMKREAFVDQVLAGPATPLMFSGATGMTADYDAAAEANIELKKVRSEADRLRQQYQQLIRAMAHDAEEVAAAATALQSADIGFAQARAFWAGLENERISADAVRDRLVELARGEVQRSCDSYVLALCGQASLDPDAAHTLEMEGAVLFSDRTGAALAAPNQWVCLPGKASWGVRQAQWLQARDLGKPMICLLPKQAPLEDMLARQAQGVRWLARAAGTATVVDASSGRRVALAKLDAAFEAAENVSFKGREAMREVAEVPVLLVGNDGASVRLRCVISRVTSLQNGKILQQKYTLSNVSEDVSAATLAQWQDWGARVDACLRLTSKGVSLAGGMGELGDPRLLNRMLVAGQVATTAWRLMHMEGDRAERTRLLLTELSGHPPRQNRQHSAGVLYEGLAKLFHLLDALETDLPETAASGSHA